MPKENEDLQWQCFLKDIHKFQDTSDFPFEQWNSICFAYMQGALTKITDKNVAFAGIAKEIQALMEDDYFAGLWGRTLLRGLCWCVRDCR